MENMNDLELLVDRIDDIISSEVYLRNVPYSMMDGEMETDPDSIRCASMLIVKMLKDQGWIL